MKLIIWALFSQNLGPDMGWKQHWSHFWMISGGSRMGVILKDAFPEC